MSNKANVSLLSFQKVSSNAFQFNICKLLTASTLKIQYLFENFSIIKNYVQ